eukprot:TRINITY_DN5246_c0_g1_i1.p1 TRINITY_DN5246_c0_g1~~TRINITY_DN5246_c0_g1_i1.p1  ORF type:complete len:283 (-),score=60.24 TRINITY_DN5246_c0_g1_i1:50-898(-)
MNKVELTVHSKEGLTFSLIDPEVPIEEQGEFDLIICKCNRELSKESLQEPRVLKILANFLDYEKSHPNCVFLDSVAAQKRLMSRTEMSAIFDEIPKKDERVIPTRSAIIHEGGSVPADFPFPAMAKALVAAGSVDSHEMGVVFNAEGLNKFKKPVILQEYLNHDSVIEKVYVVGEKCWVVRKTSLPNYETSADREPLLFNSQKFEELLGVRGDVPPPPQEVVDSIAKAISETAGLTLFGFDIIRDSKTGKYAVIDLNFFPSYRGTTGFREALQKLVLSSLKK